MKCKGYSRIMGDSLYINTIYPKSYNTYNRGGPSNLIKGGFQADDTESAIDKFLSIPDKTITVKFIVCYLLIGLKKITHQ